MTREELAEMFEVVEKDLMRYDDRDRSFRALITFCMCAAWHLRREPTFIERNDAMKDRARSD